MSISEQQQTPAVQTTPEPAPLKYQPLNSSINLITSHSLALYHRLAPQFVADYVSSSELVHRGLRGAEKGWELVKPAVHTLDTYSSHFLEWSHSRYQKLFLNRLQNLISGLKRFYRSENNDFARITLKLLTKLMPDPRYIQTVTESEFIQVFKWDPKFSCERVQLIIKTLYKNAQKNWTVTKETRQVDLLKNILFIVAATMEEVVISAEDRVQGFAEKLAQYFLEKADQTADLLSQVKFREYVVEVMNASSLTEGLRKIADDFLEIVSVLFDLANLSDRDLVDWTMKRYKRVKMQIKQMYTVSKQSFDYLLEESTRIPREAYDYSSKKAFAVVQVGKEKFIDLSLWLKQLEAVQYCLNVAQKVDLALRHNVESVKRILKKNEEAFVAFVSEYQQELLTFVRNSSTTLNKYSKETRDAVLEVLEKQKIRVLNIAELGKETMEMLFDATAQFMFKEKQILTDFFVKNSELLKEETKALGGFVFKVLRIDEIASIVMRHFRTAEEYLCIRESLSKLDVLTFDSASQIYENRWLAPAPAESD
jgi:GTP cyclohydrolase II